MPMGRNRAAHQESRMVTDTRNKVCLIIGAGDGLGGALARVFAAEGLTVCVTRRERNVDQLNNLVALTCPRLFGPPIN